MPNHINANKIKPSEQKGNASNTYGTIDQLIINKIVTDNVKLKQLNISKVWIDYKKVFDSVRHDWIIEIIKIHKFSPIIAKYIRKTMNNWKTSLHLNHQDGQIKTNYFSINTGIFKGDILPGLLSILSLFPLSWLLNTSNIGYRINWQGDIISHLLFMDDLKLFAANDHQLASMIKIVNKFSDDIGMTFGIDKCKKLTNQRRKIVQMENIQLDKGEELKSLELNQEYKYLGFGESLTTDKTTKSALKNEYFNNLK